MQSFADDKLSYSLCIHIIINYRGICLVHLNYAGVVDSGSSEFTTFHIFRFPDCSCRCSTREKQFAENQRNPIANYHGSSMLVVVCSEI